MSIHISIDGHIGRYPHASERKRGLANRSELMLQSQSFRGVYSASCLCTLNPWTLAVFLPQSVHTEQVALLAVLFFFHVPCVSTNIINEKTASPATHVLTFL